MNLVSFIHETTWSDLPSEVQRQARRCLLDTVGAGLGGRHTPLSRIIHDFAAAAYGGDGARLWFDGRSLSPPGAALANGMTIDALDAHDGHPLVKGHAGAAVVPAALATAVSTISGRELLAGLVVGYEVALRAGIVLHRTALDYHTSGAWNALGCAALTARRRGLNPAQTEHALGIAEYHGPRSQMMRCIDFPTMLKDGSGWGAMAGVSAGLLAEAGFTGAPALTVTQEEVAGLWADLGERWRMLEQYFKPHAVCRWAQPAVAAAAALQEAHGIAPGQIKRVEVWTFHEATRLAARRPATTEEAQYSLPFPVAAMLQHGRLGPAQLSGEALRDPETLRLAERVTLKEDDAYNEQFPARRLARVRLTLGDGIQYRSPPTEAAWDANDPPGDAALRQKFRDLAAVMLPAERAETLLETIWHCHRLGEVGELLAEVVRPLS